MRSLALLLLVCSPAFAQPPKAPPISVPPKAPPVVESAPVPTRANGYVLRQHWDGRTWQQWWEPEGGVAATAVRPFSQTPAVVVSGSTQTTGARNVVVPSTSFPGVAPYQGRIRTLAPLGILGGTWTSNCPTGVG